MNLQAAVTDLLKVIESTDNINDPKLIAAQRATINALSKYNEANETASRQTAELLKLKQTIKTLEGELAAARRVVDTLNTEAL